ncbi:MAG: aldo/keto reductase [Stappiaceae bacterium]
MQYKSLGRTGVKVSQLCFGTMSFGGDADEATSAELYKATREAGINFYDCADVYSNGRAEEILGDLVAHERDDLIITSKVFGKMGGGVNDGGTNRRHIALAVEASLKRLKTDRLDVYFVHRWDDDAGLDETLRGLEDVVRSGKVLYLGVSNYAAWQIAKALGVSAFNGWNRFEVIQPMYNLVKRQAEVEILPLAQSEDMAVISYSPLGGGLLTGKYAGGASTGAGRLKDNAMYASRYGEEWVYDVAKSFSAYASAGGHDPVSLAIAWVGAHPGITSPIIGARNTRQLEPALRSANIEVTSDLYEEIAALSPTPSPATDRSEEAGG